MRTLGTSHSRAIVKIIQDRSLPPTLEICEFRFDVNNEQHDFQVSYIIVALWIEYVTEISLQYHERHENTAQEARRTRRQTVHICKQSQQ